MRPKVAPAAIKARSQTLRTLDRDLQAQFRDQFLGETAQVLIESEDGVLAGRAERYFEVEIGHRTNRTDGTDTTDPRDHPSYESYSSHRSYSYSSGDIVTVRLEKNGRDAVLARIA